MRVGLFTNNYLPRLSGVSVAVNFIDTALKKRGHETAIIAPDYGHDDEVDGADVYRITSLSIPSINFALPLASFDRNEIRAGIEQWRPDIIHSHHPFLLGEAAMRVADEFNIPLVYTFHTLYEFFTHYVMLDFDAARAAVRNYVLEYVNQCDLVIAPTEPIREYLLSIGATVRVETVPTGIDFSRFKRVTPEAVDTLAEKYGIRRFDATLLSVGRITEEKNVQRCLDTLVELVARGHNVGLLMLGDGPDVQQLKQEAKRRGVGDRLIMGGFLDQDALAVAYHLGDVFLFPSPSDTQGIVLYEAQAAGMPIVATKTMASQAAVHPGENGLFADDDPRDFADKVEQILADRQRYSKPLDTDTYSHDTLGCTYERLYRETMAAGRTRPTKPTNSFTALLDEVKSRVKGMLDQVTG